MVDLLLLNWSGLVVCFWLLGFDLLVCVSFGLNLRFVVTCVLLLLFDLLVLVLGCFDWLCCLWFVGLFGLLL